MSASRAFFFFRPIAALLLLLALLAFLTLLSCSEVGIRKPEFISSPCDSASPDFRTEECRIRSARRSGSLTPQAADKFEGKELFNSAIAAFHSGRYNEAQSLFQRFVETYITSSFLMTAMYNRGISLERLDRFKEAEIVYLKALEIARGVAPREEAEIMYRLSMCYDKRKKKPRLLAVFHDLRERAYLLDAVTGEVEYPARYGLLLAEEERLDEAELFLVKAVEGWARLDGATAREFQVYAARAFHSRGQVSLKKFVKERVPVNDPLPDMEKAFEKKTVYFMDAQKFFLRAIEVGDATWASKSVLSVGKSYSDFYDSLEDMPVPKEFDRQEAEVYRQELRKKLIPLLRKAIRAFKQNVALSRKLDFDNRYVKESYELIDKIETKLDRLERSKSARDMDTRKL